MSLIVVAMIVGPVVSVNGEEKQVLTWIKIHDPGTETYWKNLIPKEGEYFKSFSKGHCDVGGYKINVDGKLGWFWVPNVGWCYGVIGGTMYEMDTDFAYEGRIYAKFSYYENMMPKTMNFSIIGTYTFDPNSPNHNINGTIKFHSRSSFTVSPTGWYTGVAQYNGHGTGDLKGVIVQASKALSIWDPDMGVQYLSTQIGTVKGWPTHLNTP